MENKRGYTMRKSKRNIGIIFTVIAVAALLLGTYFVYDSIFPLAEPIECPSVEDVISVTVSSSAGEETKVSFFASLIMQIQQVKPTRKMSVNDTPTARPYYKLQVATEEQEFDYFVYTENNRVYLEIPYVGIYTGAYSSGDNSLVEIISDLLLNHAVE